MFISKIKDLTRFNKKKDFLDLSSLEKNLSGGLFKVMEKSFSERQSNTKNSSFSLEDKEEIIKSYAKKNMVLAAASSIIPGPLGILGAVPELILNFGNQMFMIYDLGCAYNKESFINKDLLLDIPFAAFGGNTQLAALQTNTSDLLDAPQKVLMGKAKELGKSVIERTLKKSIVQFIPVGGPLLMGIWAQKTTKKIASITDNFLDEKVEYVEHFKKEETDDIRSKLQIQKIKALANLIECNDVINEDQISFIGPIIENADVPQSEKNYLLDQSLKTGSKFTLDYQLLIDYEEDEDLVSELVVMAKRSGQIDLLEKQYILQVADELKVEKSIITELLAS